MTNGATPYNNSYSNPEDEGEFFSRKFAAPLRACTLRSRQVAQSRLLWQFV
jgi:hypothetical protein